MTVEETGPSARPSAAIELLHVSHPRIRAKDWRSPLVIRILREETYFDGTRELVDSFKPKDGQTSEGVLLLTWTGLKEDYESCLQTYQELRLTEFAALAVACILLTVRAGLQITEVTRMGDKVDYWLGNRELLLEVSGTKSGDLPSLCESKAAEQLIVNPLGKSGFVCVARFDTMQARLWYYTHADDDN
jgi:hypothetical protein